MALRLIPAVHRATHQIGLSLERARALEVNQAEAHLLAHLAEHGDATIARLHQAFGHKRSTLTSILDRLADRGLVTRETDAADRRSFVVRLTPRGVKRARLVATHLAALERQALAGVPARVRDAVLDVLARLEMG